MVVTAWRASGGELDGAGLVSLVSTMSTTLWFGYAVLVLAIALTAQRVARRVGVQARAAAVAGVVVGCAACWPTFLGNYLVLGFETAVVCAAVLATAFLELVCHAGQRRAVVVTAAAVAMVAHTWQLLLPAVGCAFLAAAWAHLRPARDGGPLAPRGGLRPRGPGGVGAEPAGVVRRRGFRACLDPGGARPIRRSLAPASPWSASVVALVVVRDLPVRALAAASVGTAILAVLVAWRAGVPLTHYYPRKMLWQAALLGLPATAAVGALGLRRLALGRRPSGPAPGRGRGGRAVRGGQQPLPGRAGHRLVGPRGR